jgi:hypothetical protein
VGVLPGDEARGVGWGLVLHKKPGSSFAIQKAREDKPPALQLPVSDLQRQKSSVVSSEV